MPSRIEIWKRRPKKATVYDDAVTSAVGSMAARFIKENKDKGRPLRDYGRGVEILPDGTEVKIKVPASNQQPDNGNSQ